MSEQETSDELKAAAQRVAESIELAVSGVGEGDALEMTYNGDIDGFTRDMKRLADSTLARLDADEAERAERAKPIDAEWLESIGACDGGAWRYVQYDGGKVYIGRSMDVWVNASSVSVIRTRGQLLDLVAALKGGA